MGAKKKKGNTNQQGPYKKFLHDMREMLIIVFESDERYRNMTNEFMHTLYNFKYIFQNPKAYNTEVLPADLKIINDRTRKLFYERNEEFENKYFSTYDIHLFWCYARVKAYFSEKKYGNDEVTKELKDSAEKISQAFYTKYLFDYFKVITQLSNPAQKYLGIHIGPTAIFKDNPKMEIAVEVYGFKPRSCMLNIDGRKRPAFQLASANAKTKLEWIKIDSSLLNESIAAKQPNLDVYIQSHALNRIKERLDVLDSYAINYLIWENSIKFDEIKYYNGLWLLPVKLFKIRVGYFACKVIEDKFLITTFLFITHSCTPEGDKLKEITGLTKNDISYWHIDRISTYINLNTEKYPELINLFEKAGLGGLTELRNKKFDIDTLQEANFDGLMRFIKNQNEIGH